MGKGGYVHRDELDNGGRDENDGNKQRLLEKNGKSERLVVHQSG